MPLVQTAVEGFAEYHKIETLFERDAATFRVNPQALKSPVLSTISEWDVTEKIDGTNIRVMLGLDGEVTFGGRTNAAQIPADLIRYLQKTFPADAMRAAFWIDDKPVEAVLYGEGYGAGIQRGGTYRADKAFILFDVLVANQWWLDRENVTDVANKLGIDEVPYLGRATLFDIVEMVRHPFPSRIGTSSNGHRACPVSPNK